MNNSAIARVVRSAAKRRGGLLFSPLVVGGNRQMQTALPLRRSASSLPTILQPSFWKKMVPKPLRRSPEGQAVGVAVKAARQPWWSKEWNPATFYIAIFLCIGSMAIQMISLKKGFEAFMRQSEVKIGQLREVIESIQRGENVDVKRALGTGDPIQEAEWDAALRELERDEPARHPKRQEKKTSNASSNSRPNPPTNIVSDDGGSATPVKVTSITNFY